MNWLERARREIGGCSLLPTAKTAETIPMTLMAVSPNEVSKLPYESFGSFGSMPPAPSFVSEDVQTDFEERAAIMEFDGGLSREEAERAAWVQVAKRCWVN